MSNPGGQKPTLIVGSNQFQVQLFDATSPILNANGKPIVVHMPVLPRVGDLIAMDDQNNVRRIRAVQYRNVDAGTIRVLVSDIQPWTAFAT
jgi:hypothetical protein